MNTLIKAQLTDEFSTELFEIVQDEKILHGTQINFDTIEDTYDGLFPRTSDYTRLANRLDTYGTSEFLTWISQKPSKLKADYSYCKIIRESKNSSNATLLFQQPITVAFAFINDKPITGKVNAIEGEFIHEWYSTKNGRQNKIANGFEIKFHCSNFYYNPK